MADASIDSYYVGRRYTREVTADDPIWLAVLDYTQRDIDKAANSADFKSAAFRIGSAVRHAALLKYTFAHQPPEYLVIGRTDEGYDHGSATRRNPNAFDLIDTGGLHSDLLNAPQDFRTWWDGLTYGVEDSADASVPDGRASLLSQMAGVGILGLVEQYDIPAALEIIRNTTQIKHVSWAVERDILIPLLEARLVNHWHLMSAEQQAKHTKYVPPSGDTSSSGTSASGNA